MADKIILGGLDGVHRKAMDILEKASSRKLSKREKDLAMKEVLGMLEATYYLVDTSEEDTEDIGEED